MNARLSEALPAVRLRAMQEADLAAVMRIENAIYPFPWSIGVFRDCVRSGYSCWVQQADDDSLVGYAVMSVAADEAHMLNVCIAPERQSLGYGRRLVAKMLEIARWNGAQQMFLEVRPSNPTAQALYRALGFEEIGRRPRYYPAVAGREDAIVMSRALSAATQPGGL
jgi:ribosomal-protein-alanine N-acetyltransferase